MRFWSSQSVVTWQADPLTGGTIHGRRRCGTVDEVTEPTRRRPVTLTSFHTAFGELPSDEVPSGLLLTPVDRPTHQPCQEVERFLGDITIRVR